MLPATASPASASARRSVSLTHENHPSLVDRWLVASQSLVLGLWFGAMVFFSAAVAPSAFGVLPTRQLAGTMVNSVLGKLEWWGVVCGLLLIGIQIGMVIRARAFTTWVGRLSIGLPVAMTLAAAVSKFVVSRELAAIRAKLGPLLESLPLDDPTRLTFATWHQYSVWLMGFSILAAAALIVLNQVWLNPARPGGGVSEDNT
ncbi:MAG: DUF4149 domain-containing protein [Chloracidobacterium sp.]|nr:DUF4149 domain-containing protein [Chloracidobacterium validum]